jgi:SAM-dependent methyltransferase
MGAVHMDSVKHMGYSAIRWMANRVLITDRSGPAGVHITRFAMNKRLLEVVRPLAKPGKILSISHSLRLCENIGLTGEFDEANYPQENMLRLTMPPDTYDFVVSDQVLEHVEGNPYQAVAESFRVLKPGGIAIHTTCFVNPVHGKPYDFWRFSPEALALLCRPYGDILEVGGWGNPYVWVVSRLGLRWEPVPESPRNLLTRIATYHDPEWPVATWVVARKRASETLSM